MAELERAEDGTRVYRPDGKTLEEYVKDRSEVCGIVGPIGSGTSTASCMRIWATANEQRPSAFDGKRRSRWVIVRPTYPELLTSTLRTWTFWFPEEIYGRIIKSRPMSQRITVDDLDLEIWFLALDGPEDIEKIRSTEWTGGFMNEAEFQNYEIFKELRSRVVQGRFPSMAEGGPTWNGIIFDMNAPNEEHWVARMAGWAPWPDDIPEDKRTAWPKEWKLLRQPPGLIEVFGPDGKTVTGYVDNPEAENTKWLSEPYSVVARGMDKRWIDSRVMNRISFLTSGDPVWPMVKPELHFANHDLVYVPGREVIVALDFGRRPSALMFQEIGDKLHFQCEFRLYGVGAATFAPALKRFLEQHYRGARISFTGDPKGADHGQASEQSAYDIFESYGMRVIPARGRSNQVNDVNERVEAVAYALRNNRILVGTRCPTLIAALSGKYVLDTMDAANPQPMKRGEAAKYSDIADCLQYGCLFIGEGRRMVGLQAAQTWTASKVAKRRSLRKVSA